MKKVMFSFVLVFIFMFLNINTSYAMDLEEISKPLICYEGCDYSKELEYDGYEIINGKVDFYNTGSYYITYMNLSTKKTITKRVDVINNNSFIDNLYYKFDVKNYISSSTEVIDSMTYETAAYILEASKVNDLENIIITKYENNQHVYSKVIKTNLDITLRSIFVDDDGVYVLGNIYKEQYGIDIYLLNLDFNADIICENTFGEKGIDNSYNMFTSGEYIYVFGDTTSNSGIFKGIRNKEDGFILKISKNMLCIDKCYVSSLNYGNTIKFGTIQDNLLIFIEQYIDIDRVSYLVKVFDQDLNITANCSFINSYSISFERIKNVDNRVFLIGYQYNYMIDKYASRIYEISKEGESKLFYEYTNYEVDNKRIIDINTNNNTVEILLHDLNTNEAFLHIKNNKLNIDNLVKISNSKPIGFCFNNSYLTHNKEIISYLYLKDAEIITLNGKPLYISNKSQINENQKIFGKYRDLYIYESNLATYIKYKDIYIEPSLSFINNEIFDIGLILEFNGKGVLNGKEINSGKVISKVGKYTLTLVGNENERKEFQFEVKDLSCKTFEKTNKYAINKIEEEKISSTSDKLLSFEENEILYNSQKIHYWIILIPICLLLSGFVLIMVKKNGKKSNKI